MKVFFTFGGLPHYYNYVLNRLNASSDIELKVIVPAKSKEVLGRGVFQTNKDIKFEIFPLVLKKAWYGKYYFAGLSRLIKDERPDILVTIWPFVLNFLFNPYLLWIVRKNGVKLIFKDIPFNIPAYHNAVTFFTKELRNENLTAPKNNFFWRIYYFLFRELTKGYMRLMDAHVYYSKKALDIIPTYGVDKKKIFITYNSIDTDQIFELKKRLLQQKVILPKNNYRILHVGRLVAWKKVDQLVKAFKIVKDKFPDSQLVIVGDGPQSEYLKLLVNQLNLKDNILFIKATYGPEALGRYFIESTIYVLAGMGGLSINEAMAHGKPIICSVADGTELELVRDGINGYFFIEDNIQDLAQKIISLLSDRQKIEQFGLESLRIVKDEINIHTVVEGYLKAFKFVSEKLISS